MAYDLYQTVTDNIVAEIEKGSLPWVKPWSTRGKDVADFGLPFNATSRKNYRGINILLLWGAKFSKGYTSNAWLTFKQANALGGSVKKGEKATQVVYASKFLPKDQKSLPREEQREIFMMKGYYVFNVEQCENLPDMETVPALPEVERHEQAEQLIAASGASITHTGGRAFYTPMTDSVTMPAPQAFKSMDSYYSTMFHELGHWTGAKHRLGRDHTGSFGSSAYAFEELVAELASAFVCAGLQIQPENRHSDYIASWLKALKDDKKFIFKAASAASKAADMLQSSAEEEDISEAA